ncbi:MAG: TetR/AcrR family transcriptional regulator [Chloroflexi bacterium]|nr:TetR/AcrR family transcriptional regulator [Chloroflexota bacterium]
MGIVNKVMNDLTMQPLVQVPQQTRSRKTMNRILDVSQSLLEEKGFDELTIAEIVQRANCSVGAFYGRFRDKEALLHALDERFFQEFIAESEAILDARRWEGKPIAEIIEVVIAFLVGVYGKQIGVLRALTLRARLNHDVRFGEREQTAWDLFPRLQELLLARADEIAHPNPELAVRLGFLQVFYALREILLWEHLKSGFSISNDQLVSELTCSYLAYLGAVQEKG